MADIQELYRLLKELEDQLATCMKCGMCQAVCPLYAETGRETDVARGKIALLEFLASQMLRDPEGVKDRLDKCLLCGSCAANCPSGVKVLDIFLKARAIITSYQGLSRTKKIIFRGMLARPGFFNKLLSLAARFQGIFTKQASQTLGSSCARCKIPLLGNRHFVPLAQPPWHRLTPSLNTAPGSGKFKVAFFPGCLTDKVFPSLAKTAVKVFNHHQIGTFMPEGQACCGIPALASGDKETFIKLVTLNIALLSKQSFDYLVTPCATCTSTIKKVWPMMPAYFSRDTNEAIKKLAGVTLDINAFLVDYLGIDPGQSEKTRGKPVTYHDPCHLKKSLGVSEQPRQLIRSNSNYTLKEMNEADRCCGMGGSFNLMHYDISQRIGTRKLRDIIDSEAKTVATGCPACMLQIIDLLSQEGRDIEVKHVLEIYAETLD